MCSSGYSQQAAVVLGVILRGERNPPRSPELSGPASWGHFFSGNVAALLQRSEALMLYFCVVGVRTPERM